VILGSCCDTFFPVVQRWPPVLSTILSAFSSIIPGARMMPMSDPPCLEVDDHCQRPSVHTEDGSAAAGSQACCVDSPRRTRERVRRESVPAESGSGKSVTKRKKRPPQCTLMADASRARTEPFRRASRQVFDAENGPRQTTIAHEKASPCGPDPGAGNREGLSRTV